MRVVPEFRLNTEPVSDDAKNMTFNPWSDDQVGTRHKIGGKPTFIQKEHWPICKDCHERMSFYGQLDSLNDADGQYDIADCGLIYVFFCFECNEVASFVHSY